MLAPQNLGSHLHYSGSNIGPTGVPSHQTSSSHSSNQDYVHNMYNLSLNSTSRYESSDELKPPSYQSESYDSFPQERPPSGRVGGIPRTNSFDSTHSSVRGGGGNPYHPYNSHTGNYPPGITLPDTRPGIPHRQDDEMSEISISELTPSRFGSKRDSHTDRRDSPYYTGDSNMSHRKDFNHPGQYYPTSQGINNTPQSYSGQQGEGHYPHTPNTTGPYSDTSHHYQQASGNPNIRDNAVVSSPTGYGYEETQLQRNQSGALRQVQTEQSGALRQQAPPTMPQFESPPPHFIRQDPPLPNNHGNYPASQTTTTPHHQHSQQPQHSLSYTESPEQSHPQHSGLSQNRAPPVTVMKYSKNYVEVSKPFEMADVYKYSEKIRKHRFDGESLSSGQTSPSHSSSGLLHSPANSSSASSVRVNSPYLQRATHIQAPPPPPRSRSESPSLQDTTTQGSYSSSHYSQQYQGTPQYSAPPQGYGNSSGYTGQQSAQYEQQHR